MNRRVTIATMALGALVVAGCGSSSGGTASAGSSSPAAVKTCTASIGMEGR